MTILYVKPVSRIRRALRRTYMGDICSRLHFAYLLLRFWHSSHECDLAPPKARRARLIEVLKGRIL